MPLAPWPPAPASATKAELEAAKAAAIASNPRSRWAPAKSFETISRAGELGSDLASVELLVSGQLWLAGGATVPGGQDLVSVTWLSGAVALEAGVHQWFSVYRQADLALLAVTVDDGVGAWAANSFKTLNLQAPLLLAEDTDVYIGITVVATKCPALYAVGIPAAAAAIRSKAPVVAGASSGGLAGPEGAPNPAAALASARNLPYAFLTAA